MKKIALLCCLCLSVTYVWAQDAPMNMEQLFHWEDRNLVGSNAYNNTYNEIWGYARDGREYAIIGSTAGTHIFDVTDPANSTEVTMIPGAYTGGGVIHRDYHDYNDYLYMVCDEGNGISTLQIADLSKLPAEAPVVYDSDELFSTSHNIFIDTTSANLFVCALGKSDFTRAHLEVYTLAVDPIKPIFIKQFNFESTVHDIYVRNDTAFANIGSRGLVMLDFSDNRNPVELGRITEYSSFGQGYNHSGWMTDDGKHYFFADETHGLDIKVVDISDMSDAKIVAMMGSDVDEQSIAHNLIYRDGYLFVSYYHDGLQVFDVHDPLNPVKVASFDTYAPDDHVSYRGAWGVYPHLPSGNILVSDMQTGLYVLKTSFPSGIESSNLLTGVEVFPTNISSTVNVNLSLQQEKQVSFMLYDLQGKLWYEEVQRGLVGPAKYCLVLPEALAQGAYLLKVATDEGVYVEKLVKQ